MQIRRLARSLTPLSLVVTGLLATGMARATSGPDFDSLGMATTNPLARIIPSPLVRWHSSMAAFAAADRERAPATDGVLFVGSSTIRMWSHLAQDFRTLPVINRGFGGSTMADCQYFVRPLVVQYKPRQILVYAGDNDLAEGRSPQQVLESFKGFVEVVRQELPEARISYISIKPSPSRAVLMPKIREANSLLAGYVRSLPNAAYIDVFTPMLDASGAPRGELFGPDKLHMNDSGYALWTAIVGTYVTPPNAAPGGPVLSAEAAATAQQAVVNAPVAANVAPPAPAARPPLNAMRAVYRP